MGHYKVCAGSVQFRYISFQIRAADDLDIGRKPATVNCQVNVGWIVMGGNKNRRGRFDSGLHKCVDVSRTAVYISFIFNKFLFLFYDSVINIALH